MPRFWPYWGLVCLAFAPGCAGRSMEGLWEGPLPTVAGGAPCRIRLLGSGVFDYRCRSTKEVEGAGKWDLDGERLRLKFEAFSGDDASAAFEAAVSGPGNRITLQARGEEVVWQRAKL